MPHPTTLPHLSFVSSGAHRVLVFPILEVLREAGESVSERVRARNPVVLLLAFGNSSVDFEVSIWAEDPWRARVTRSALNMAVWRHMEDAGITIAFPQRDVHFDKEMGTEPTAPSTPQG